jgi:hypothetical protein
MFVYFEKEYIFVLAWRVYANSFVGRVLNVLDVFIPAYAI